MFATLNITFQQNITNLSSSPPYFLPSAYYQKGYFSEGNVGKHQLIREQPAVNPQRCSGEAEFQYRRRASALPAVPFQARFTGITQIETANDPGRIPQPKAPFTTLTRAATVRAALPSTSLQEEGRRGEEERGVSRTARRGGGGRAAASRKG